MKENILKLLMEVAGGDISPETATEVILRLVQENQ